MAAPITTIYKQQQTKEEVEREKLEDLKSLLTENEEALNRIFAIIGELNDIGVLETANSMLQAKDEIAKIALGQVTREPVTNMMNNLIGAAGALSSLDPDKTMKLINSLSAGLDEGSKHLETNKKIGVFELLKVLQDPDANRAIGFGIHFLKGMGKGLKGE